MNTLIENLLREVLTIAEYRQNKEEFIAEFEKLNFVEAMTHIYDSLSNETQELIKANSNNPDKMKQYIPKDAYIYELKMVSRNALIELARDISFSLNLYQKEKINRIIASL